MNIKNFPKSQFVVLSFFIFSAFFYGLASYPLLDMNEGLYAEIAREMLATKNFLIPHLNYVPYLEKPPLFYWLLVLSYKIFGVHTFAARLVPAVCATLVTAILCWFLRSDSKKSRGFITGLILASSLGYVIIGRVVFFDMLLLLCLSGTLCCFYLWWQRGVGFLNKDHLGQCKKASILRFDGYIFTSYIFLALAFLTKGLLPVILVALIGILFLYVTGTLRQKFWSALNLWGILVFFGFILAWVVPAARGLPNFVFDFFINEQLLRFINQRLPHDYHTGAFYFYLPRIFVYLFPWCLLIVEILAKYARNFFGASSIREAATGHAWRNWIAYWQKKLRAQDPLKVFCWVWFLAAFFVLSLSAAKGDYYMVLGVPPLAILLAQKIETEIDAHRPASLFFLYLTTFLIIAVLSGWVLWRTLLPPEMLLKLAHVFEFLTIYYILGLWILAKFKHRLLNFILIAGLMLPVFVFGVAVEQCESPKRNQVALAEYIHAHNLSVFQKRVADGILKNLPNQSSKNDMDVFLFQDYEEISTLLFNLKRRLPIIDSRSRDLYFGSQTVAAKGWFISNKEFLQIAKTRPVYVVLLQNKLADFQNLIQNELTFQQVFQSVNGRVLLLSNQQSRQGPDQDF